MKKVSIALALGVFLLAGCAKKSPQAKQTFTTIKCEMVCENNKCNQKCEGSTQEE